MSTTTKSPEPCGCLTCKRPLNTLTTPNGVQYQHTQPPADGHAPRPAPIAQIPDLQLVCDFCGTPAPTWVYLFPNFSIVASDDNDLPTALRQSLGERWATCSGCARHIDARDQAGLTRRTLKRTGRADPIERQAITMVHRALLRADTIQRRPMYPAQPTPDQHESQPEQPTRTPRPETMPKIRDRLADYWRHHAQSDFTQSMAAGYRPKLPAHITADPDEAAPHHVAALPQFTALMAHHVSNAPLYWIDRDFTTLAIHAGNDLPILTVHEHELPTAEGLLIWETPILSFAAAGFGKPVPVTAAHWGRTPAGVWLTFYAPTESINEPRTAVDLQTLRERRGWLSPVGIGAEMSFGIEHAAIDNDSRALAATLLATWLLTAQPEAELTTTRADKATRRAYARATRPEPAIRIVRLRPKRSTTRSATDEKPTRQYHVRWWVNGFWREQPYGPKRSLRRRTYVRGHMKGRPDAPLKLGHTVRVLGSPPPHQAPSD